MQHYGWYLSVSDDQGHISPAVMSLGIGSQLMLAKRRRGSYYFTLGLERYCILFDAGMWEGRKERRRRVRGRKVLFVSLENNNC